MRNGEKREINRKILIDVVLKIRFNKQKRKAPHKTKKIAVV